MLKKIISSRDRNQNVDQGISSGDAVDGRGISNRPSEFSIESIFTEKSKKSSKIFQWLSLCLQLYMIARHSNEQSQGGGDGVEVVDNRECTEDEEK